MSLAGVGRGDRGVLYKETEENETTSLRLRLSRIMQPIYTSVFNDPSEDDDGYGDDDGGTMMFGVGGTDGTESIISDKTKIRHKKKRQGANHGA